MGDNVLKKVDLTHSPQEILKRETEDKMNKK